MLVRVCVYVFIIDLYHHIGNFKEVFFGSWQHKKIHIETFFPYANKRRENCEMSS